MDINTLLYELRLWRRTHRKTYKPVKSKQSDQTKQSDQSNLPNRSNRPNAFVSLVMLGDNYIPGALVLAHSLRLTNTII